MPDTIRVLAHAKINLTLAVTGRRPDGYHTLCSAMQSVSLANRVTASRAPREGIFLSCDDASAPRGPENTAHRAAAAFLRECPVGGVRLFIEKKIPFQAGLGSASADAAGTLWALNELFDRPLSMGRLLELAAGIGADVPFCLIGGTQRAEGIGDVLTPLTPLPDCAIVLAKPLTGISTPEAYRRYDALPAPVQPDSAALERALAEQNLAEVAALCGNALEQCCALGDVSRLMARLRESGALGAAMSGSGSAVFGIFADRETAASAARALSKGQGFTAVVRPAARGVCVETV